MIGSQAILGATAARRSGVGAFADNAIQETFAGLVANFSCYGARDLWVSGRASNASATIGVRIAWYDVDDSFLFAETERTFTADANEVDLAVSGKHLTQIEVYDIPGAHYARLWIRTAAGAGTFDLYAGVRP